MPGITRWGCLKMERSIAHTPSPKRVMVTIGLIFDRKRLYLTCESALKMSSHENDEGAGSPYQSPLFSSCGCIDKTRANVIGSNKTGC
jgi:hypothetical protein